MKTCCWIELFDLPAFQGERRRFYGPTHLDVHALGLDHSRHVSIRVGKEAALYLTMADGRDQVLQPGAMLDKLDPSKVKIIEVKD